MRPRPPGERAAPGCYGQPPIRPRPARRSTLSGRTDNASGPDRAPFALPPSATIPAGGQSKTLAKRSTGMPSLAILRS